jgi:hypothetical protein
VNLAVDRYNLTVDARRFRNNVQNAVNRQIKSGGITVIQGPSVPFPTEDPATILSTYFNYPDREQPVCIFDLGQVTVRARSSKFQTTSDPGRTCLATSRSPMVSRSVEPRRISPEPTTSRLLRSSVASVSRRTSRLARAARLVQPLAFLALAALVPRALAAAARWWILNSGRRRPRRRTVSLMKMSQSFNRPYGTGTMKNRLPVLALAAVGLGLAGCNSTPVAPPAAVTGRVAPDVAELYTPEAPAGVKLDAVKATEGMDTVQQIALGRTWMRRGDAFALLPAEASFEERQTVERILSEGGGFLTEYELPDDTSEQDAPRVFPVPAWRVAGIIVTGENDGVSEGAVVALLDTGSGTQLVMPGMQIAGTEWVCIAVDEEGITLRRPREFQPDTIRVKLQGAFPDISGAGGGGGNQGGFGGPPQGGDPDDPVKAAADLAAKIDEGKPHP